MVPSNSKNLLFNAFKENKNEPLKFVGRWHAWKTCHSVMLPNDKINTKDNIKCFYS